MDYSTNLLQIQVCGQYASSTAACQKSPVRTFLTALSAEHFESVQNAITESLDVSRLSTAVYPI